MIARNSSYGPAPISNGHCGPSSPLLSMKEVASRFNLHPNTLRKATDSGQLRCYKTGGSHRRFALSDILSYLGCDVENESGKESSSDAPIPIALVARVSSNKQAALRGESTQSDLERQIKRLEEYVGERWGSGVATKKYISVGSGLNFDRKEFIQLVDEVLAGKYSGGFVVATYFDRVCRYGIRMFERICASGNCELVFTEKDAEKECHESLADEILGILTHFTAKASGLKAKKNLKVIIPAEVLRDCYQWHCSGLTYKQIASKLQDEGRNRDERGRTISHQTIRLTLNEQAGMLQALNLNEKVADHSFAQFFKQHVKKGTPKTRLAKTDLVAAYRAWATSAGLFVLSEIAIGKWMRANHTGGTKLNHKGNLQYVGITLALAKA